MTSSVEVFRILALKKGLEFYAKTGVQVNRLWTPKGMMRTAEKITGRKFKPRAYLAAAKALDELIRCGHHGLCIGADSEFQEKDHGKYS